jgi:hypothetical protein
LKPLEAFLFLCVNSRAELVPSQPGFSPERRSAPLPLGQVIILDIKIIYDNYTNYALLHLTTLNTLRQKISSFLFLFIKLPQHQFVRAPVFPKRRFAYFSTTLVLLVPPEHRFYQRDSFARVPAMQFSSFASQVFLWNGIGCVSFKP